MSLVVFTALVGLAGRAGPIHPVLGFTALLCIALGAGAAGALNMWYDADIDALMRAPRSRPIPAGACAPARRSRFGLTLAGVLGRRCSACWSNWLAAAPARLHHLLLRRRLHDVAEALDAAEHRHRRRRRRVAAGDRLGGGHRRRRRSRALLLFLIIFLWTPPHFWALALYRRTTTRAPACRCCRSSPATQHAAPDPALHPPRAARHRCPGCSAMPARSTASPRLPQARL